MTFGAFVEIAPNKKGMIHISKLSKEKVAKVFCYSLYVKVPWYKGFWKEIPVSSQNEVGYFVSLKEAKERAQEYVDDWIETQKKNAIYKEHKEELRITKKIIAEFNISSY